MSNYSPPRNCKFRRGQEMKASGGVTVEPCNKFPVHNDRPDMKANIDPDTKLNFYALPVKFASI